MVHGAVTPLTLVVMVCFFPYFCLIQIHDRIIFQNVKESMIHQMERSNVNLKSMPWIRNVT